MLHIYRASAGSGKTYRLTQDYIELLFEPKHERAHRHILAVTFTNKATEEMKSRILKELHALSTGNTSKYRDFLIKRFTLTEDAVNEKAKKILTTILHDYSSFSISTIDRFFQQVIRSFARDIGIHGGYNLELDTNQTLEQSIDNLFIDLSKEENKDLLGWLTAFAEERIEQSENWNTRNNILELGHEIFKENYQNKAEVTTQKLHDREFLKSYRNSLVEIKKSFEENVKRTAQEALNIIAKHGLMTDNFKGGSRSAIKTLEHLSKKIVDIKDSFINMGEDVSNCYAKATPADIKNSIESAYENGLQERLAFIIRLFQSEAYIHYNSSIIVLKNINTLGILSDLAAQIKKLTNEQNTMLISDANLLLNKIIDNSDSPFVYEKTGIYIDNFMIDEFQDTSVLQWKNFKPLIENSLSSGKFNLVVGDVKQSIYRWRNSDWKLLDENIKHDFRDEQMYTENLETNYRSDQNIVNFNNAFFNIASSLLQNKLNEKLEPMLSHYPNLQPLNKRMNHAYENIFQKTKVDAGNGHVKVCFIEPDEQNSDWKTKSLNYLPQVLEELQEKGYKANNIAILVRTNKEEVEVIHKLLNYKTTSEAKEECCYDILGNEGLLISSAASVRFILGLLELFVHPEDPIQQTIVNYEYARGRLKLNENEAINKCFTSQTNTDNVISSLFSETENTRLNDLQNSSLFDMVEQIISLFEIGDWHHEAVFIQAFQDVVFKYSIGKTADLNSFLTWWNKNSEKQCISTPDDQNAIRIMTIHKSKGLDFEAVIIPFADWELDKNKGNNKSYLWATPTTAPFNDLPLLPVEYNSNLEKSIFAENYFDEQMHRYIDNLNLAYVAFTRPKHELICFAPFPKKEPENIEKVNSMSGLLLSILNATSNFPKNELMPYFNAEDRCFELGIPTSAIVMEAKNNAETEKIQNYPTINCNDRLHIRHQSKDFWLENQDLTESRLNYGLIMHEILQQISSKSDQDKAISEMIRNGRISESESKIVMEEMEKFWKMDKTESWFAEGVKVLNEATILTPDKLQYRPDRVIFSENNAIIVDYKFGDTEKKSYTNQVKKYMELIADMGYNTEGYVCYVSLGKLEKIGN